MVSRKQRWGRRHSANHVSLSTTGTSGVSSAQRSVAQFVLGSPQRATPNDIPHSHGTPLHTGLRKEMETLFGADFADVRLHTDVTAQRSATEFGARAYTSGRHIVAGPSGLDRRTIVQKLPPVLQRRQGPVAGTVQGDGLLINRAVRPIGGGGRSHRHSRHDHADEQPAALAATCTVPERDAGAVTW